MYHTRTMTEGAKFGRASRGLLSDCLPIELEITHFMQIWSLGTIEQEELQPQGSDLGPQLSSFSAV